MNVHIAASANVLRRRRSGCARRSSGSVGDGVRGDFSGKANSSGLVTAICSDHAVQTARKISPQKAKIIQKNSVSNPAFLRATAINTDAPHHHTHGLTDKDFLRHYSAVERPEMVHLTQLKIQTHN
ncbi:hypothetical protein [Paraburkholderia acidisoli]|uniref:Uncharacterized protein n=1 Tax=Paraburkholderia acidisoli TaxID=2571748 RepID=A0A7Z2GKT5_9BURK|nr:hypothetical protein [Paraburkholderia acidisoli]QGZ63476.1 hypothetical protein FAZ98_16970 [Paraburkholderia acidisoli]